MAPLICSNQCFLVSMCQPKAQLTLWEQSHGLVHCVPHPHPTPCSSKDHSIAYSPFVVVRAKRGALLCCRRPGLWGQALLSHFGLDLNLTVHIQGVRGQRGMWVMRNMAQIPVPDPTSIHSTLFQRCCSTRLNVIGCTKHMLSAVTAGLPVLCVTSFQWI